MKSATPHDHTQLPASGPKTATAPYAGKWMVFALAATGVFMSSLDGSIVNIALPSIMADLEVPLEIIEWVPMIYMLTISSFLLTFGRLSDTRSRKWVYLRGFFLFALGSLFCAVAQGAGWLLCARAFQGIGAAMLMACSPALVVDAFPVSERGRAIGIMGTVVAAGLTTGPALGGLLLNHFSWPVIFYINIPIGLAATVGGGRVLRSQPAVSDEPMDWVGTLLLMVCFSSLILGLTHIYERGIGSPLTGGLLAGSAVSGLLFARVEARSAHPLFDPDLLKIRLFALPVLSAVILFLSLAAITFLMPFFLVHPMGLPINQAGMLMMVLFVFFFFVGPISGAFSDRIGSRLLCTLGMGILATALFLMSRLSPSSRIFDVILCLAMAGFGISVFMSPNSAVAMSAVPFNRRGIAAATVAAARNMGMVLGVAMAGLIFNSVFRRLSGGLSLKVYRPELEPFFMAAYQNAMLAGTAMAGVGMVVSFLRGREASRNVSPDPTAK